MPPTKRPPTKRAKPRITKIESLDMTVPEGFGWWITRHVEWMRVRNYSEDTVTKREPWLVAFAAWCAVRGILRPREVTKPILERYRRHLYLHRKADGRPLTFGSQVARLTPLKLFFAWMARQNALLWNPASELDLPKVEKRLPRPLTTVEMEIVLAQPNVAQPRGLRDRAIMETLYSTGMRRSELIHLTLADFVGAQKTVFIRRGKGKKDRMVPIGERAIVWVDRYLGEARSHFVVDDSEEALFLSEMGTAFHPNTLSQRVANHVRNAKIGRRGSCHVFRHTMATLMLEGGADIRHIQEMLGHVSLDTTEIYTRVSILALRAVHEATHPAARLSPATAKAPLDGAGGRRSGEAELFTLLAAEAREEDGEGMSGDDVGRDEPLAGVKRTKPTMPAARRYRG